MQSQILKRFLREPSIAHGVIFASRHMEESPYFHEIIRDLFWSEHANVVVQAFRGGAKSTICEEYVILSAAFGFFKNILIIGSSFERAVERLRAIKWEIQSNEMLSSLCNDLQGETWSESRVILSNGVCIQVAGMGQALRGIKHRDSRPDLCVADDLETDEHILTPAAQEKTMRWFMGVLLPAMAPKAKIRILGTPLDPNSLLEKLMIDPMWKSVRFPIEHLDEDGRRVSSWEERFPLVKIDEMRDLARRMGTLQEFEQEYMCCAIEESSRVFRRDHIVVQPINASWLPKYVMVDPARSTSTKNAQTGYVVWSWYGKKLVIWEAYGKHQMPDEILDEIFLLNDTHSPVVLAVEEDGLAQFLLQPLRTEIAKRGVYLPLQAVLAPRDRSKADFIKGLQPFFEAGDVVFAKHLPELEQQMLNFPTGKLDIINALAYCLRIHRGKEVYEAFSEKNVLQELTKRRGETVFLALHSDKSTVAGVLMQYDGERLRILGDWVREGEAASAALSIIRAANVQTSDMKVVLHPAAYSQYQNTGVKSALLKSGVDYVKGADPLEGRRMLSVALRMNDGALPDVMVSTYAKHTLAALAGGFAREIGKDGTLSQEPMKNASRLIMEAIESFYGNAKQLRSDDDFSNPALNYRTTSDGRTYLSSIPR